MALRTFKTLSELIAAVDETIGPGDWMTIDQQRVDAFADTTEDRQWIHVDRVRAAAGPYGTTIAHGYLTLALLPKYASDLICIEVGSARVNYGLNRVRFPSPARTDDRFRATCRIASVAPARSGCLVTSSYTVESEREQRPVCLAETVTLLVGATPP